MSEHAEIKINTKDEKNNSNQRTNTYRLWRLEDDRVIYEEKAPSGEIVIMNYHEFITNHPEKGLPTSDEYGNMDEYLWTVTYD